MATSVGEYNIDLLTEKTFYQISLIFRTKAKYILELLGILENTFKHYCEILLPGDDINIINY